MFEFIKRIFVTSAPSSTIKVKTPPKKISDDEKLSFAICLLLVDIAKADDNFSDEERKYITQMMKNMYNLDDGTFNKFITISEENLKQNDSIYEYTTLINKDFTNEEKFELIKKLWQLIFIDQNMDIYEEHLVKKIGGLLDVEYRTIIAAKLIVKEKLNAE